MTNDDDPRSTNKRSLSKNFPRFPIVPLLRNYNLFLESGKLATMEKPNLKLPFRDFRDFIMRTGCSHFSPSSSSSVLFAHNAQLTNSNSNANSSLVLSSFSSLKKQRRIPRWTRCLLVVYLASLGFPPQQNTAQQWLIVNRTNGMRGDRTGFSNFHGSMIDPTRYFQ